MARRFFTTQCWQKTSLGTEISLCASSPLQELKSRRPILLIGGVHGDEPEGVELAQKTLEWLQTDPLSAAELVPWIVIPCLNIDGFKAGTRVNARGVDLNRNYPSRDWSPDCDKPRYFPGTGPASEPEIQGLVRLIEDCRPRLIIHCHSWEPMIVCTGEPGLRDAQRLATSSGYLLADSIGYPTPGSLSRYGWHDKGIPIICIEEQENLTDVSSIWPRFSEGMREIFSDCSERTPGAKAV